MTKQPKRGDYQDGDIFIFIGAVILFFALLIILIPHVTDAASNEKLVMRQCKNRIIFVEYPNRDESKAMDIFKSNPKNVVVIKDLTLNDYIWQFLTDEMELSDEAAAGIFGNMMVECGSRSFNLQPYIYSPGGAYYGLCQWGTTNHHSGIRGGTIEQQLEYLRDTIESEMGPRSYSRFTESDTASGASIIFAQYYERCADPYGRQDCAERAYERFAVAS